jgi:cell wall assembly regulator SMI1
MRANAPAELRVDPPASAAEVADLERAIGRALPADLRDWFSIHAGAAFSIWSRAPSLPWTLVRAQAIAARWKEIAELHAELAAEFGPDAGRARAIGPVSPVSWKPAWIPLAREGGNVLCADMQPEAGGTVGQLVVSYKDSSPRRVAAPSLTALFRDYADDLELGKYEYEPFVGIVPRDE